MTEQTFDLIVIGAGPAGYVASIRAAQLGINVACVEKEYLGGTCLNVGCIPSKALLESSELYFQAKHGMKDHGINVGDLTIDLQKFMDRKNQIVSKFTPNIGTLFKKKKVTSIKGRAKFTSTTTLEVTSSEGTKTVSAKNILIATGSAPVAIPNVPFDGKRIIDSTGALALTEIPNELIVIGGGYIGLEMGSVYMRLGSKVTVIEALDRLVPAMDNDISSGLQKVLTKQGMEFKLSTKVQKASVIGNRVEVTTLDPQGNSTAITADYVLVAVGRRPYTDVLNINAANITTDEKGRVSVNENWQTSTPNIYAVGDVIVGPMLAHKASEEGTACVERIANHNAFVNYDTIPGVIYTWPEAASVGITEEQAKEQGINYKVSKFPFMANGRAISMNEKDGFVKLIASKDDDRILGAHILGPRASDMIAEIVLGMEFSTTAADIALTIHAHPTLSEAVKEARSEEHT